MVARRVLVFQHILALRQVVDPNVQFIPSVEAIKRVLEKNVRILVPDFVDIPRNVLCKITYRLVLVWMVIRVTLSPAVNRFRLVSGFLTESRITFITKIISTQL